MFWDYRNGLQAHFFHNPGKTNWLSASQFNDTYTQVIVNDTQQDVVTTGSPASISNQIHATDQWLYYTAPNLSNVTTFGLFGWGVETANLTNMFVNSPGITIGDDVEMTKSGVGDNFPLSLDAISYGGATAASDEGHHDLRFNGGEANTQYSGTVATGSTGATSLTVNCTQDCTNIGDGRYLMLTAPVLSGAATATTNPSGNIPGNFTINTTVTPSTAWGTLKRKLQHPGRNTPGNRKHANDLLCHSVERNI
jgi:hypothetical protein